MRRPAPSVSGRVAVLSVTGFVAVWLLLVTLRAAAMGWPDQGGMLVRRIGMALLAGSLAYALHLLLERLHDRSMAAKAAITFASAFPVAALFSFVNYLVFYRWFPVPSALADLARWGPEAVALSAIGEGFVDWFFVFAAWVAFRLALEHAAQARAAERRSADARADAQEARLAMLRLQVDPHFLFNALNALSSMVALGQTGAARQAIHDLASFFRAGLNAEPAADVPLGDEIELQRLYLAVEQSRFGDRLRPEFDVPASLEATRVPALILQPLVENAVRHGVARTGRPVTVRVSARLEGDRIRLTVWDDAGHPDTEAPPASGIGLRNVRARLEARHGAEALLVAAPAAEGWLSEIVLPARA